MNRTGLIAAFVRADTEEELQTKLFKIGLETGKDINVTSIYLRGSKIVAWFKLELRHVELKSAPIKKTTRKKIKKDVELDK